MPKIIPEHIKAEIARMRANGYKIDQIAAIFNANARTARKLSVANRVAINNTPSQDEYDLVLELRAAGYSVAQIIELVELPEGHVVGIIDGTSDRPKSGRGCVNQYIPTPEQIRESCREVQREWTPEIRRSPEP